MSHEKLLADCTTLELLNRAAAVLHVIADDTFRREAGLRPFDAHFAPLLSGAEHCLRELAGRMEVGQA